MPLTWFMELSCTLRNRNSKDAVIWAELEEVSAVNAEPHAPLRVRQFIPLGEDEATDRDIGSNIALSGAEYKIVVRDSVELKWFFKLDEGMNVHRMAFCVHFDGNNEASRGRSLFTFEV